MLVLGNEPPLVSAGVSLLWIIAGFCLVGAVILGAVGTRLWSGGRTAARAAPATCAQVRTGGKPVHLSGTSAEGPAGLIAGPVSGTECVWYRNRVYRVYQGGRWRDGANGWEQVPTRAQELVWEGQSGPFALRDETGRVLVDPVLVDRRTTSAYPKEEAADDSRESGPEPANYAHGPVGALMSAGLLPTGLLEKFAAPDARTYGYRVTEEIIRPGVSFHLYAIASDLDGKPLMTPMGNTPAISVDGMGMVLSRGGRTAAKMALSFGLGGAACLVLSGLLLAFH